jgi:amino acid adenylation domain-containing protein/thioester reductase-like protein
VALISRGRTWTYREIDERANQLAQALIAQGAAPERVVGVLTRRDENMAIAALAVAKAGAVYLPLDLEYPEERLRYMLANARASLLAVAVGAARGHDVGQFGVPVLTFDDASLAGLPTADPAVPLEAGNLLYLIYTSGSTGRPKAIAMDHGPTVDLLDWSARRYAQGPVAVHYFPVTTDVSYFELFGAWWSGGTVVVATEEDRYDIVELTELIRASGATKLMLPAILLDDLAQQAIRQPGSLATVCEYASTGDRLIITDVIRQFFSQAPGAIIDNQYGSTEVNVVTVGRLDGTSAGWPNIAPVGRPVGTARVYVLDENLEPVPANVPGGIYIGGLPLCRGYQGQAALTARAFLPDPYAPHAGARMYRTGDRGLWQPSGQLQCLGRSDFELKIHGHRVDPGEIEALLREHPDVAEAAVAADDADRPDKILVAYVVPANSKADSVVLRRHLGLYLPALVVPQLFVFLDELPLTGSGKVDRRRLPELRDKESAFVAPRTSAERAIARIWCDVLGQVRIGVHDNFFKLGGHSLLVSQVVYRMREQFQAEVPLRALFDSPTVALLADEIPGGAEASHPALRAMPRTGDIPLSYAQQGLWFLNQLFPDSAFYNNMLALRITGSLDAAQLNRAFTAALARHEALRTRFPADDGVPAQVIDPVSDVRLDRADLSSLPRQAREQQACVLVGEQELRPFDLARGPLLRGLLIKLGPQEHVLAVVLHHIISDARSLEILQRDLLAEPRQASAACVQYADYAIWQRQWLTPRVLGRQQDYWRSQLDGAPKRLELVTDYARDGSYPGAENTGATFRFTLGRELTARLTGLSNRCQATPFMTALTALAVLLSRYSLDQRSDIIIGVPMEGRTDAALESVVGFFINSLPLRIAWSGDPAFEDLLSRVREITLDAYANQDLPFSQLVEMLGAERDITDNPLFQVMLQLQYDEAVTAVPSDLRVTRFGGVDLPPKFDLSVDLFDTGGTLEGIISYPSRLFHPRTIAWITEHFVSLLEAAVSRPGAPVSTLLTGDAERQRLALGNAGAHVADYRGCAHELVSAAARADPAAIAVADPRAELSYAELNARANRLAYYLIRSGLRPEDRVGVCLEPDSGLVTAMLAVLKAGGAYLPLDPALPPARLSAMVADATPTVVLTAAALRHRLPATAAAIACAEEIADAVSDCPYTDPPVAVLPGQLAYVLYTSGSTGQPKGVMIQHDSLVGRLRWMTEAYAMTPEDRVLMAAPMSFDVSLWEMLAPLAAGAMTVLPPARPAVDDLAQCIDTRKVTIIEVVPSLLTALIEEAFAGSLASLQHVICGSEVFPRELARSASGRLRARLYNSYGPTEATIDCTLWPVTDDDPGRVVPIGHAIAGARLWVLDDMMRPTPAGMPGELYIGGPGVGRGYLGAPGLTAARFVPDPFNGEPGARLYRTGDIVRQRYDAELEYMGRTDEQVKVRGFRVELGEIEAHLAQHPQISSAAVATSTDERGECALTACVVPTVGQDAPESAELRAFLRDRLPDYMVPAAFATLSALPLAPSGKVDRAALPAQVPARREPGRPDAVPATPVEKVVAATWERIIGIPEPGVHTDFFALGGHSLLVPRITASLAEVLGIDVPPRVLFELPTVAELAAAITDAVGRGWRTIARAGDSVSVLERERLLAEEDCDLGDLRFGSADPSASRSILLTGATGFVGRHLLAELLAQTDAAVYCLVRADSEAEAAQRLRGALSLIGVSLPEGRVVAVLGDLSSPRLGLRPGQFTWLAAQVDTVVHSGARVNALLGYRHLRSANVLGTRELLRLAAVGDTGSFHLLSTTSAADPESSGYAASKRAAERLAETAAAQGLRASAYRLERVSGASDTGLWNDSDLMARIIQGSLQAGVFPELGDLTEAWTPVDAVARAVTGWVADPAVESCLHIVTGPAVRYQEILSWIRSYGHRFSVVPPSDWASAVAADPTSPAYACVGAVLRAGAAPAARSAPAMPPAARVSFLSGVDESAFHRYLDHLAE